MFDYIQYITSRDKRLYPIWERYKNNLLMNCNYMRTRFMNHNGYESRGIALLKFILSTVDMSAVKAYPNDLDFYTKYLSRNLEGLENPIDPVQNGIISYKNLFIMKKSFVTDEHIFPVRHTDYYQDFPWNEHWDVWKQYRSVRLWETDSHELTYDLTTDLISYKEDQPTYAVITVDVAMLIYQYLHFLKESADRDKTPQVFLHRYILSGFFYDMLDSWLLKLITTVLDTENEDIFTSMNPGDLIKDVFYGNIGVGYREATISLHKERERLINGTLPFNSFLSSDFITKNSGTSIIDRVDLSLDQLHVRELRQYWYLSLLRDRYLIKLLYQLITLNPSLPWSKQLIIRLKQHLIRIIRERRWEPCLDMDTKLMLRDELLGMYRTLQTLE